MRHIDTKYLTTGEIMKHDGTRIPDDEPLLLLRGRDLLVVDVLVYYRALRVAQKTAPPLLRLLDEQIQVIQAWQAANPTRTQIPR